MASIDGALLMSRIDRMPEWQFYAVLAVVSGVAFLVGILMG